MSFLEKVNTKLFIASNRKAINVLEGLYASVVHSKSLDFDDLRQYQYGDNVKDIDWKSTARSENVLVRRFVGNKQIPVIFVVDTGLSMNGLAPYGGDRKSLAVLTLGVLGMVALQHGDQVSLVSGDSENVNVTHSRGVESHLEYILHTVNENTANSVAVSNISGLLTHVMQRKLRKSVIVVVAGSVPVDEVTNKLLTAVHYKHDLLWVNVADCNPLNTEKSFLNVTDIETGEQIPDFISSHKKFAPIFERLEREHFMVTKNFLDTLQVSNVTVGSPDRLVTDLVDLLHRRVNELR